MMENSNWVFSWRRMEKYAHQLLLVIVTERKVNINKFFSSLPKRWSATLSFGDRLIEMWRKMREVLIHEIQRDFSCDADGL